MMKVNPCTKLRCNCGHNDRVSVWLTPARKFSENYEERSYAYFVRCHYCMKSTILFPNTNEAVKAWKNGEIYPLSYG